MKLQKAALVVMVLSLSYPALAVDTAQIVEKINGITTSTDAVGGAFVSVAVGMIVFGFIIGMIFRRGR